MVQLQADSTVVATPQWQELVPVVELQMSELALHYHLALPSLAVEVVQMDSVPAVVEMLACPAATSVATQAPTAAPADLVEVAAPSPLVESQAPAALTDPA